MKPHLPIYTRPPNTLLRYEDERFTDRSGNSGVDDQCVYPRCSCYEGTAVNMRCKLQYVWTETVKNSA